MNVAATIGKVLKLPSLKGSYLAAGFNALERKVKRIDILDLPYPEVDKYLEPGELILTTFWNSRDNPEARLGLTRAIREKGGAGLGIMPSVCLGQIDQKIIEYGNQTDLPIICLPPTTRWSDIINDFGRHFGINEQGQGLTLGHTTSITEILAELMSNRARFLTDSDLTSFLKHVASIFGVTVALKSDEQFYIAGDTRLTKVVRGFLLNSSLNNTGSGEALHYLDSSNLVLAISRQEYILLAVVGEQQMERLSLLLSLRPLITEPIDTMLPRVIKPRTKSVALDNLHHNEQFHLSALRLDGRVTPFLEYCNQRGIHVFNLIPGSDILIVGIPGRGEDDVYLLYNDLINRFAPSLLVISSRSYHGEHLNSQLAVTTQLLEQLSSLDGLYELEELPLLYAMTFMPFHIKEMYYRLFQHYIDISRLDTSTATTFRLYLILKSTRKVGCLQGIHANTVKYRIQKVLRDDQIVDDSNILSSLPTLPCLLGLEMLSVEDELLASKAGSKSGGSTESDTLNPDFSANI